MNGKTHQISGLAAVLGATFLTIKYAPWIASSVPAPLTVILTPPPSLAALTLSPLSAPSTSLSLSSGGGYATTTATSFANSSLLPVVLTLVSIMLVGLISGQFPDLDTPQSTIANSGRAMARQVRGGSVFGLVAKIVFSVLNILPLVTAMIANHFFGHRGGIIHGLVGLFGTSLLVGVLSSLWLGGTAPYYGFLFFVGYATHLLVDSLSKSGVKWFWPLSARSYHLLPKGLRFDTGNDWHNGVTQLLFGVLIGLILWGILSGSALL